MPTLLELLRDFGETRHRVWLQQASHSRLICRCHAATATGFRTADDRRDAALERADTPVSTGIWRAGLDAAVQRRATGLYRRVGRGLAVLSALVGLLCEPIEAADRVWLAETRRHSLIRNRGALLTAALGAVQDGAKTALCGTKTGISARAGSRCRRGLLAVLQAARGGRAAAVCGRTRRDTTPVHTLSELLRNLGETGVLVGLTDARGR